MQRSITIDDLIGQLGSVTSQSDARALLNRAQRIARVRRDRPLEADELLRVCESLAAEGGMVQQIAEIIARQALTPEFGSSDAA